MRISDWSSDVCSSDLAGAALDRAQHLAHRIAVAVAAVQAAALAALLKVLEGGKVRRRQVRHMDVVAHAGAVRRVVVVAVDGDGIADPGDHLAGDLRSEEHTSELQSLMRISYAVF